MAKKELKVPISVRLPKTLLVRLNVYAAKTGQKRLDLIVSSVERFLREPTGGQA